MTCNAEKLCFRLATLDDLPALHALIDLSARTLQTAEYSASQIDAALGVWLGVDTQLVRDETYFVAESPNGFAACGGWSRRKTPFGSDNRPGRENALLDPATDAAKIRAFFVHPGWARQGIGARLLTLCEEAARAEGFCRFEMGATLTGVPLYQRYGYTETGRLELPLASGEMFSIVSMMKEDRQ